MKSQIDLLLRNEEPFPVLLKSKSKPERFTEVEEALRKTAGYLPFWRSESRGVPVNAVTVSEDGRMVSAQFADGSTRQWEIDPEPVLMEPVADLGGETKKAAIHQPRGEVGPIHRRRARDFDLGRR